MLFLINLVSLLKTDFNFIFGFCRPVAKLVTFNKWT